MIRIFFDIPEELLVCVWSLPLSSSPIAGVLDLRTSARSLTEDAQKPTTERNDVQATFPRPETSAANAAIA